jgi:hypothetical protein
MKQKVPIEIAVFGIEIDVNDVHTQKQKVPIEETEFEIEMNANDEHP